MQPDSDAGRRRFNRSAESRSARADDEHIVLVSGSLVTQSSLQSVEHAHRAQPDVEVGQRDAEQAGPRELHVPAVEAVGGVVQS